MKALLTKYQARPKWVEEWIRIYQDLRLHKSDTLSSYLVSLRWEHLQGESREMDRVPSIPDLHSVVSIRGRLSTSWPVARSHHRPGVVLPPRSLQDARSPTDAYRLATVPSPLLALQSRDTLMLGYDL
jgi:hypothetical protein